MPATLKEWIYAIIALVLGVAVWRIYSDGEARIADKDKEVQAAAIVHNEEVESRADIKTQKALQAYKDSLNSPVTDAPSIVCKSTKTRSSAVPSTQYSSGSDENSSSGAVGEKSFDPGPAAIKAAREADAQLKLAQESIQRCIEAKMCKVVKE